MLAVIEGIDGSGKGTVTKELAARLRADGKTIETVSFPMYDRTLNGRLVGRYLNGEFGNQTHPYLHGSLYALDRYEAKPWLLGRLAHTDAVISDRYIPSNLCYSAMKADPAQADEIVRHFVDLEYGVLRMPVPDVIFFLDVPVNFALANIAKKEARSYTDKASDIHEADEQYLSRVRSFYMSQLMKFHPATCFLAVECVANDKLQTIDSIVENVYGMLNPMLKKGE